MDRTDTTLALIHDQKNQADANLQEHRNVVAATHTQLQELVQSVQHLSSKVSNLDDDIKGEKNTRNRGEGSRGAPRRAPDAPRRALPPPPRRTLVPSPVLQAIPITQGQSLSSSVTPTGSRLPSGDPMFVNRNFQGIHIVGEPTVDMPDLGPRDSIEEILRREAKAKESHRRRVEAERRDPPRPKRARGEEDK